MPQLSHTAEETKATIRLSHRYLTKPNRLHSWSSWHITKRLKRRNGRDKKATPVQWQQYNDNHNAHTERWGNYGRREVDEREQTIPESASLRSSHWLVNSSSGSGASSAVGMSAQQYLPQLCVHRLVGRPSLHTPAAWLTNNSKQLVFLADAVQTIENYTGKRWADFGGPHYYPDWKRTVRCLTRLTRIGNISLRLIEDGTWCHFWATTHDKS